MTLAESIAQELERRIVAGIYDVDTQLPTEPELANDFGASRTSIRAAVGALQARGFVSREQGRGTFVRGTAKIVTLNVLLDSNLSITSVIKSAGYEPGMSSLAVSREIVNASICRELSLPLGSSCVVVRRTRTANAVPAADSVDYLIDTPKLSLDQHAYEGSLYELLTDIYSQSVTSGVASIAASVANADTSARLDIPELSPLLLLCQVHALQDGTPVMYSVVSLRTDVVHLYAHRGQPFTGSPETLIQQHKN